MTNRLLTKTRTIKTELEIIETEIEIGIGIGIETEIETMVRVLDSEAEEDVVDQEEEQVTEEVEEVEEDMIIAIEVDTPKIVNGQLQKEEELMTECRVSHQLWTNQKKWSPLRIPISLPHLILKTMSLRLGKMRHKTMVRMTLNIHKVMLPLGKEPKETKEIQKLLKTMIFKMIFSCT